MLETDVGFGLKNNVDVVQLAERNVANVEVAGSLPVIHSV